MNLQEFIKTALAEIVAGVGEARSEGKKHGATIGSNRVYGHLKEAGIITDNNGRPVTTVEFDIALAEANASDTKGGIGVFLGSGGCPEFCVNGVSLLLRHPILELDGKPV